MHKSVNAVHKSPYFVTGKQVKPSVFLNTTSLSIYYRTQKPFWLASDLYKDQHICLHSINLLHSSTEAILVLDSASSHTTIKVLLQETGKNEYFVIKYYGSSKIQTSEFCACKITS